MTSEKLLKDSGRNFIALQLDMLTHRIWLAALSGLTFFMLYFVVPLVVLLHTRSIQIIQQDKWLRTTLLNTALQLYGTDAQWNSFAVFILAVLFAFSGFAYLYKMRSLDFYESEPFTRWQRFLMISVNNMLIFLPVLAAATAVGMLVTLIFGGIRLVVYFEIALQMARLAILFFAVCGAATLAAVLSGNIVIAILMMGFLTFIELFVRLLFTACGESYFTTVNSTLSMMDFMGGITSPTVYDTMHLTGFSYAFNGTPTSMQLPLYAGMIPHLFVLVIMGAVAYAGAYFAYRYRKLEHTGRGLCYPFAESIVKVAIALMVGMYTGLITDIVMETQFVNFSFAFLLLVVLTVTLTCVIGEIIFAKSIHAFNKRIWQIPVCIAVCFVVLYIFKLDAFGYDRYVPAASEVASASLSNGDGYYTDDGPTRVMGEHDLTFEYPSLLSRMELQGPQVEALCEIAKVGMQKQREIATAQKDYDYYMGNASYEVYDAFVLYRLKNGKKVTRHIAIPYDIDESLMNAVIDSDRYKTARFDTGFIRQLVHNPAYMKRVTVTASYEYGGTTKSKVLDADRIADFLNAYEKDLSAYDYSLARTKQAAGAVHIEFNTRAVGVSDFYPDGFTVYDSYRNTIAYLKEQELYHGTGYKPKEIAYFEMYLTDQMNDEQTEAFNESLMAEGVTYAYDSDLNIRNYADKDQIKALCKVFRCMAVYGDWYPQMESEENYYLYAHLDDAGGNAVYGAVPKKDAPAFLKKDLENALK